MKAGYAQEVITPSLDRPVYLAGFGQNRRAETVHDDLYVRALALAGSSRTLVLCGLDLIGFFRADVADVLRRVQEKAPGVDVVIASLHPHHGPDTMGMWGPDTKTSGVDRAYLAAVKDKTVAVILAALGDMRPASGMKTTSCRCPGLAKNARDPQVVDDELTLLQILGEDGGPLATLYNFPCHPEVLWEHNTHITADYPGVLRREAERLTGRPVIFFPGALGGMMTPDVKDHSFEEAEHIGVVLAQAGAEALSQAPFVPGFEVSRQRREVSVMLTNVLFRFAIWRGIFPDVRDKRGLVHSEVSLLKIGPLWFAAVPGELLPKLGRAVKASLRSAGAAVAGVIGLANDELGYILPRDEFRYPLNPLKPGKHYEETMSISKEIGPTIVGAVKELLHA
jgi:hypothetical protein